jgi:hypothetical protein
VTKRKLENARKDSQKNLTLEPIKVCHGEVILMEKDPILVIDKPDFVVTLHKEWIDIDLKEGGKAKLERAIEKDPLLRKTLGFILQTTIPSDVNLCDVESVEVDGKGQLKLVMPRHADIVMPLGIDDANRLAYELKDLIPLARERKKAYRKRVPLHTWWPYYVVISK